MRFTFQCLVPMPRSIHDHLCHQAKPILQQEAIFDDPDQIPKPANLATNYTISWVCDC